MSSTAVYMKDLQNWVPDLDPRRLAKTAIISGQNFLDDVDGPKSYFGHSFADFNRFSEISREKISELKVNDEFFYGTPEGVFRLNPDTLALELIIAVNVINTYWPWTVAFVGNIYYFAQYNIGLFQFNAVTNAVQKLTTPANDLVRFVCASYGRVIALSDTFVMWSALDDGTDFEPSTLTGAGAQVLSIIGKTGYRVDPVADGFIVSTENGLLKGEQVAAVYVWRFYVLSNDVKIKSPNAGVILPDIGYLALDKSGFHITNGAAPQPWEADFGTYLKDNIIKNMDERQVGNVGMYFSQASRILFVYFAPKIMEGEFNQTFAYYMPSQGWGEFHYRHHGIFETQTGLDKHNTNCFMDLDGYIKFFNGQPQSETLPTIPNCIADYLFREASEPAIKKVGNTLVGVTEVYGSDFDCSAFDIIAGAGLYLPDAYGNPVAITLPKIGLNSVLDVGMFRFAAQQQADEVSGISTMQVGVFPADVNISVEDYNDAEEASEEDYNDGDGSVEDYGNLTPADEFTLELLDTDDGFTEPPQGWEMLFPMDYIGATITFSATGFASIYKRFRFSALNPGEQFRIKFIDIGGQSAGRRV